MMDDIKIARINELAKKKKTIGLTEEEIKEQAILRKEFIDAMKANVKAQLDNIDIVNEDGSIDNLGELHERKFKDE